VAEGTGVAPEREYREGVHRAARPGTVRRRRRRGGRDVEWQQETRARIEAEEAA